MKKDHRTDDPELDKSSRNQLSQVSQLFARIQQEIEEARPPNVVRFIVSFLCKHYPDHLQGLSSIINTDSEFERYRLNVAEFFKAQKLPPEIAAHFINAGFDTLESLCTLTAESLDDIEKFNQKRWLPGHKVRLQQTFADIAGRVRIFTEEQDNIIRKAQGTFYCTHPEVVSRPTLKHVQQSSLGSSLPPAFVPSYIEGSSSAVPSGLVNPYTQANCTATLYPTAPPLPVSFSNDCFRN